ncbi:unnamed protein product, partial [marine sediment metagenome]
TKTLAVFVGAGVSRVMGCKGWDDLASNLVKRCTSITKPGDGSPLLTFRETEILARYSDHKKTITICYDILKDNGYENNFFEELEQSFKPDEEHFPYRDIYQQLYGLRGLFITTNADKHFDLHFNKDRIIYKNFHPDDIDPTKLYRIHGSILDRESLVFKVQDYIRTYRNNDFQSFLRRIFNSRTVLFVGYGMSEFELLDFIITKADTGHEIESKHFILLSFYTGEEADLKFEQQYHNKMGITVVAYQKDQNGYNQLYEVIKDWNTRINQTSTFLYETYKEIED